MSIVSETEFILNLAWMLLCIGALSAQVWRDGLRLGSRDRGIQVRRTLSVLIAALALFPVVSASDDRIRLADLQAYPAQQTPSAHKDTHSPLSSASIEDPEHGQTVDPFFLSVTLRFFPIAFTGSYALARWFSISSFGRAPPRLA
jgi:hypothetical protein